MSSSSPRLRMPHISAVPQASIGGRYYSTTLSSGTKKKAVSTIFQYAGQTGNHLVIPGFQKLPVELLVMILHVLESDKDEATVNALANTCKHLYKLANPLLYRNVRLRDLTSIYLFLCTCALRHDLALLTQSLYSDVQWFNCSPLYDRLLERSDWNDKGDRMIWGDLDQSTGENLISNVFHSWDRITALVLLHLRNLRKLHLPRYFEAIDRSINAGWIARAARQIAKRQLPPSSTATSDPEKKSALWKLEVLNLLPDSTEGWNHFRTRQSNKPPCIRSLQPFLRIPSIKVLRTVLDEKIATAQYFPVGTPSIQQQLRESPSSARIETLELVARWTEMGGVHDYLKVIVDGLGKGTLKSLKLRWLPENIYSQYLTWIAPNNRRVVAPQRILLPHEIGTSLSGVADTLEELVLPESDRIAPNLVFTHFGPWGLWRKLRVLQGSVDMVFGRYQAPGLNLTDGSEAEFFRGWLEYAPDAFEKLVVETESGEVPAGLIETFEKACGP